MKQTLGILHRRIRHSIHLKLNELPQGIPDADHPFDPVLSGYRHLFRIHPGVLTKVDVSVHQRIREVSDRRISRD